MEKDQYDVIKLNLQSGVGFTRACIAARISPKDATEYVLENGLLEDLREFANYMRKKVLANAANELNRDDADVVAWNEKVLSTDKMITDVHLWESVCEEHNATDANIITAYNTCLDDKEVATMIGTTHQMLLFRLAENVALNEYVRNLKS